MATHCRPPKRSRVPSFDLAVLCDTLTEAVNRDAGLRTALEEKIGLVDGSGAAVAARLAESAFLTELLRVLESPTAADQKLHELMLAVVQNEPASRSSSVASRSSKTRNARPGCVQCDECLTLLRGGSYYKCIICADYMLCLDCDRNKCGHAHPMLYITPDTKVPNFIKATLPDPPLSSPCTATKQGTNFHKNTICDDCQQGPIQGARFRCCICDSFELCQRCIILPQLRHDRSHVFLRITSPDLAPDELAIDIDEGR